MARSFDGASDKADTSTVTSTATTNMTMCCWVLRTATANSKAIFINGTAPTNGFEIGTDSVGTFFKFVVGVSSTSMVVAPSLNTWYHVLIQRDTTTLNGYVNGVISGAGDASAPVTPTVKTSIGYDGGSTFFPGSIADAAIWNAFLSTTEITSLSKGIRPSQIRPKSLVGYWPLAGLQSPEPDLSGSAKNLTLVGTQPVFGPPLAPTPTARNRSFMLFSPTPPRIYGVAGFASAEW